MDKEEFKKLFPCEIGDTLYFVSRGEVKRLHVFGIELCRIDGNLTTWIKCKDDESYGNTIFLVDEIGESIFLTEKEAEKEKEDQCT